jgi:hypothetical protein
MITQHNEDTMTDFTKSEFAAKLNDFIEGCQRINHAHMDRHFPTLAKSTFSQMRGKRYVRVVIESPGHKSVHCFVDQTNGDVLKAAGWKAPAKHARGNIFDEANGLGTMGEYGPAYLR